MCNEIVVSAVVIRDDDGRVLTVRKKHTSLFMFPGGKLEGGETPSHAAVREVTEEVGVTLSEADLIPLGTFSSPAANEPGRRVRAHVFEAPQLNSSIIEAVAVQSEIAELLWLSPSEPNDSLAPLLRDEVFPVLTNTSRHSASQRVEHSQGTIEQ